MQKLKKPTAAELADYAREIGFTDLDPEAFIDHYEAIGWRVGKAGLPMKCWRAAVRTWRRNQRLWNAGQQQAQQQRQTETPLQRQARLDRIDDRLIAERIKAAAFDLYALGHLLSDTPPGAGTDIRADIHISQLQTDPQDDAELTRGFNPASPSTPHASTEEWRQYLKSHPYGYLYYDTCCCSKCFEVRRDWASTRPKPAPAKPDTTPSPTPKLSPKPAPAIKPKPTPKPAPAPTPPDTSNRNPGAIPMVQMAMDLILENCAPMAVGDIAEKLQHDPRIKARGYTLRKLHKLLGARLPANPKRFRRVKTGVYDICHRAPSPAAAPDPDQAPKLTEAELTPTQRITLASDPAQLTAEGKAKRLDLIRRLGRHPKD